MALTQAQKVVLSRLVQVEADTQLQASHGTSTYIVDLILSTSAQQRAEAVRLVNNYLASRQAQLAAIPAQFVALTAEATAAITEAMDLLNAIP